jgi:hypothetical protein
VQGKHPQHRGVADPALLGTVERYFLEIRAIPRLRQRIACCIFSRSFAAAADRVRAPIRHQQRGWQLDCSPELQWRDLCPLHEACLLCVLLCTV